MKPRPRVRAAVLAGYPELARELGQDPAGLLRSVGLGGEALLDAEMMVPLEPVVRLLEATGERAGIEDFGLRFSERHGVATLGAVSLLAREQATLREALHCYARYIRVHNEGLTVRVEESAAEARLILAYHLDASVEQRQAVEFATAVALRVVQTLLGSSWRAKSVCFRHGAPRDTRAHRRILGVPVRFGAAFDAVCFPARDLDRKLTSAAPELAVHAERYLRSIIQDRAGDDVRERVERAILGLLPTGLCSSERVARHLGVNRRTLHRHLARFGCSFSELSDACRARLALRYVAERDRSLAEVARLVGFSSISAFSRWFKTRNGHSPSWYRAG